MSCCARGGSWFKTCGGDGHARLQHTWYEGIDACKARTRSSTAVGQQANAAQQKGIGSSHGAGKVNSKGVITAAKPLAFSSVNMSTSVADTTPIIVATGRSTSTSPAYATRTTNSKVITGVSMTIISMSGNRSTPMSSIASASTPDITQGCEKLLNIALHINLLVIIVFQC